jgi:hypothetical protein
VQRRLEVIALSAVVAVSAALRLWGIGYAPTAPLARPDEQAFILGALESFKGPRGPEILRSGWPEGFFRITEVLQWLEAGVLGVLSGKSINLGCLYALNPGALELPMRLWSVLIDLLSCALIGAIVRRVWRELGPPTGLPALGTLPFSLGFLALGANYLVLRDAHFGVSDATMLFGLTLCLYAGMRALLDGARFLPLMGLAAGTAFGVKYAAVPAAVTCAVAILGCIARESPARPRAWGFGVVAVLCALAGFWLTTPSAFSHPADFWAGFSGHRGERFTNHARIFLIDPTWAAPPAWRFYLFEVLPVSYGWLALSLSVLGLVGAARRGPWLGALLMGSALAGYGIIAGTSALFVRYAAPIIPSLAVGLGLTLTWCFARLGTAPALRLRPLLVLVGLGAIFFSPLATATRFDRLLAAPDTRDLASRWLLEQPTGTTAIAEGWFAQVYLLHPAEAAACAAEVPRWLNPGVPTLAGVGPSNWAQFIALGSAGWADLAGDAMRRYIYGRYRPEDADLVAGAYPLLPCDLRGRREVHALDPRCYELVRTFTPGRPTCESSLDMFDAFWVPFSGFHGQELPGPEIQIYRNHCKAPDLLRSN